MKGTELFELYQTGHRPAVKFKPGIEEYETFDPDMMARLCSMKVYDDESIMCLFDFSEYEEYNKSVERPVWYNELRELVTWSQSDAYPANKMEEVWIPNSGEIEISTVIDVHPVYADYKASGSSISYVAWLEEQYLKGRPKE